MIDQQDKLAPNLSALSDCLIQYQSVYDKQYDLSAIRLQIQTPNGEPVPHWHQLISELPDNTLRSIGSLMLPIHEPNDLEMLKPDIFTPNSRIELMGGIANQPDFKSRLDELASAGLEIVIRDDPATGLSYGADTIESLEKAFADGTKQLAVGWPVNGTATVSKTQSGEANIQLILDLLQRIDKSEHVDKIEPLLDSSPTLSYRLLRYLNSAASGLDREIVSVRHAIMLVGYSELKSWLSLMLANAVETPKARPLIGAAIRRAYLMQAFADCLGINQTHGDMFVCGVFSLLDQMLGKSMTELLGQLPLSEEAAQCLKTNEGPYAPYLGLVRKIESSQAFDYLSACDELALAVHEVNLATLNALAKANATR
ncbi:MAG: HDOD domain-containing protein [Burkholderiaceae bacterium]